MYVMSDEEKAYLSKYNQKDFDCPSIATDIVVFTVGEADRESIRHLPEKKLRVLLINRATYPYKGMWALPGGFCRKNEEVYDTARRELFEETGIKDAYLNLSQIYGEVNRDPRGWIISHAYLALIDGEECTLRADTDAWDAKWFDVCVTESFAEKKCENNSVYVTKVYDMQLRNGEEILKAQIRENRVFANYHEKITCEIVESDGFAFDHAKIILDAFRKLQNAAEHDDKIIFDLMPEKFTLTELQNVFEVVLGRELLKANFRRKIADLVVETEDVKEGGGHRAAKQFVRNIEKFYE